MKPSRDPAFKCPGANSDLDHAVAFVGFGKDDDLNLKFWTIKNSWGPDWGENGYIRMERGVNYCGVATDVLSVTLN